MPIDFPTSPTTGQVYTYLGKSWVYNGTGWDAPKALSEIGAVRTFANASARAAAIPSPTEGTVTYLNDIDDLRIFDGSAWRSPAGLTRLLSQDITLTSAFIVDGIFTSEFTNYRILLRADTNNSSTNAQMFVKLRQGGSYNPSNWLHASFYVNSVGANGNFASNNGADNFAAFSFGRAGRSSFGTIDLLSPQVAGVTTGANFTATSVYAFQSVALFGSGEYPLAASFDGVAFVPSTGSFTGNVQIFGYRS